MYYYEQSSKTFILNYTDCFRKIRSLAYLEEKYHQESVSVECFKDIIGIYEWDG